MSEPPAHRRKALAQIEVDRQARKAMRRPNTRPSHDLADSAGDYDHPGYGRTTIAGVNMRKMIIPILTTCAFPDILSEQSINRSAVLQIEPGGRDNQLIYTQPVSQGSVRMFFPGRRSGSCRPCIGLIDARGIL